MSPTHGFSTTIFREDSDNPVDAGWINASVVSPSFQKNSEQASLSTMQRTSNPGIRIQDLVATATQDITEDLLDHIRNTEWDATTWVSKKQTSIRVKSVGNTVNATKFHMTLAKFAAVPEIVRNFKATSIALYTYELAQRISDLDSASKQYLDQRPLSAESLSSFVEFIKENPGLRKPQLVVTPEGNIRARWILGARQHFAIQFLRDNTVKFVAFVQNPHHHKKTDRVTGITFPSTVLQCVSPYGINHSIFSKAVTKVA